MTVKNHHYRALLILESLWEMFQPTKMRMKFLIYETKGIIHLYLL